MRERRQQRRSRCGATAPVRWLRLGARRREPALDALEDLCAAKGLRMTGPRRVIARVIGSAEDHPDVEQIHRRASTIDSGISLATVYRTVRLLEESGIIRRHDFGDGRARFEVARGEWHDHLIDASTGRVIEFHNQQISDLLERIAAELGYRLVKHRLELVGKRRPASKDVAES